MKSVGYLFKTNRESFNKTFPNMVLIVKRVIAPKEAVNKYEVNNSDKPIYIGVDAKHPDSILTFMFFEDEMIDVNNENRDEMIKAIPAHCCECMFGKIVSDPDPDDWFEDDDEATLCTHPDCHREYTEKQKEYYKRFGDQGVVVSSGDRPYQTPKIPVPDFCPLLTSLKK